jgi:hypothetical protein
VALVLGSVVWLSVALGEFYQLASTLALTAAAVVANLVLVRLDERRGPTAPGRLPLLGALVPALLWPAQLAAIAVTDAIRCPIALWTGVLFLAVLACLVLGVLAGPVRRTALAGRAAG